MRIIQTCKFFPPSITGGSIHVYNLSKNLVMRGHEVDVYTHFRENTKRFEDVEGIMVHTVPNSFLEFKLFRELIKEDFDILHTHAIWSHVPPSFFASKMKRRKIIITPHNTWNFIERSWSYILYYHTLWKWIVKHASAVIALNPEEVKTLQKLKVKQEKIQIIPNAIDSTKFRPINSDIIRQKYGLEGTIILFVGSSSLHKGVHILFKSVTNILKSYSNLYLIFVGKVHANDIINFVKEYKINNNVLFLGHISPDEMPYFYSSADIFVLPSFSEGMPTALLEAMACGLPSIGTNVGGIKEVIEDMKTGILVDPGNSDQLAEKIKLLLSDENLRRRLGENGRKKVLKNYTWEKVTDQIENLYKKVMED